MVEKLIEVKSLLGLPEELEVVDGDITEKMITVVAVSKQTAPCCPLCGTTASRIHSHYSRRLADVPCAQKRVRLILQVRKFFCDVKTCPRKIFTERLAPFIQPWARVTTRLFQEVENIGLATSAMLGMRLGDRLGIRTSWMTILRRIMAYPAAPLERVIELGIDDFCATRSYMSSCKDSRKEDLTWSSASSAEPSLNQERLGQCSRTRKGGLASVRK
jgi:transposase